MDSAEETETIKRYNNNPFSFLIFTLAVVALVAVAFAGYWCFPAILNLVQAITVLFDWFCFVIRYISFAFVFVIVLVGFIIFSQHWFQSKTAENKPDFYDEYIAAAAVVRTSPEYNYRVTEVEDDYNNNNNNNKSNYGEIVPAFEAVKECNCYGREVVEKVISKSYRRTRSEKKARTKVECRRTESERVTKTASWRSETMDGLSSEEFRMTVETFITEKKKLLLQQDGVFGQWQNGAVDQWQNGVPPWQNNAVDQWLNGVPRAVDQWQNGFLGCKNGAVDQWQNGVPRLQNGAVDQWQNGVPRLQNVAVDQWQAVVPRLQNGVAQWQGSRDDGSGGHRHRHRHRDRSHRLVGGSGSNGSGSYLAISN